MPDPDKDGEADWSSFNPALWASGPKQSRLKRTIQMFWDPLASISILALVVLGPLTVFLSILTAYTLVGPALLGPVLIVIWSLLIVGFVVIAEKTGHARNFESWDFPLTRRALIALPIAFAAVMAIVYITMYLRII